MTSRSTVYDKPPVLLNNRVIEYRCVTGLLNELIMTTHFIKSVLQLFPVKSVVSVLIEV